MSEPTTCTREAATLFRSLSVPDGELDELAEDVKLAHDIFDGPQLGPVTYLLDVVDRCEAAIRSLRARLRAREDLLQQLAACPGCIKCGPPIFVKADEGCDGSGIRVRIDAARALEGE